MKPNVQTLLVGTEGPSDALSPAVAAAGDTEPPNGHPRPPVSIVPTCLPVHLWEAVGWPAHSGRASGQRDSQVTPPTRATFVTSTDIQESSPSIGSRGAGGASTPIHTAGAAEDPELSGDVTENPGASPLPPAPPQLQDDGEEQSGAPWLSSPTAPGDGGTAPATAVTPWHAEVPSSSDALQTPSTDRGMPAASSEEEEDEEEDEGEEERPMPSVATVEGFLAAIPGEPGGTHRDGLTSPHAGPPRLSPAPSSATPLPALPTERASLGAGASLAGGPRHCVTFALGAALLAARWH